MCEVYGQDGASQLVCGGRRFGYVQAATLRNTREGDVEAAAAKGEIGESKGCYQTYRKLPAEVALHLQAPTCSPFPLGPSDERECDLS